MTGCPGGAVDAVSYTHLDVYKRQPVKFVPVITTDMPGPAVTGVNEPIVGTVTVAVTVVRVADKQPVVVFLPSA